MIPYSEPEFKQAGAYPRHATAVDNAACDFIRFRQSFGGRGGSWSYSKTVSHGGMEGQVHAWLSAIEGLSEITERLKRVQILCEPAVTAIKRFDHEDALIYCDPPYVHATPTVKQAYACEMSDEDLLCTLFC